MSKKFNDDYNAGDKDSDFERGLAMAFGYYANNKEFLKVQVKK